MKLPRLTAILFFCALLVFNGIARARPATAPAPADGNDDRLTFLTLQLSSVEESIKALTAGMKAAGYKANVAAEKVEGYEKGNELMDRKGGAPVPWDKFYGKTAKSFRTWWDDPVKRPKQFDYIYRANNDQAAKAKDEVAAMGRQVDVMLARRRKLEAEQSVLWATISLEEIRNLEIAFHMLYRLKLKAAATQPAVSDAVADARVGVLRALVLFERTADHAASRTADLVGKDQDQAFTILKETIQAAQTAAQEGIFRATQATELNAADSQQVKDAMAIAKRMLSISKNMTEAYKLALEGDAAQDEPRKLTFRAQLQDSLLSFADSTAEMDSAIIKLSAAWNVKGEPGIDSPDELPADIALVSPATAPSLVTVPRPAGSPSDLPGATKPPGEKPVGPTVSPDSRGDEVQRFTGHGKAVMAVVFTSDGRALISGGADHTIRMWDVSSAKEIRRFDGHTSPISRFSLSADGKTLASGSRDHTARTWNVNTGEPLARFKHGREVESVALSSDGRFLIVGDFGGHPAAYDLLIGQKIDGFGGGEGGYAGAFSPSGRYAATGGEAGVSHIWDMRPPMRQIRQIKQQGQIKAMTFTPDEAYLITGGGPLAKGSSQYLAYLWDVSTGKEVRRFEGIGGEVRVILISPSGRTFLTASRDGMLRLWNVATGKLLTGIDTQGGSVWGASFSPDGRFVASGTDDGIIRLWRLPGTD